MFVKGKTSQEQVCGDEVGVVFVIDVESEPNSYS